MTASYGLTDRTTLNLLSPNLDIGDVADPALRLAYFQYLADYGDATYNGIQAQFATKISAGALSELGVINVKSAPYNASGLATTFTGNITSGTKVLTLTTTPDFVQGQGINLQGAVEASSLQITAAATVSSNVTVTLNGVAFLVAVVNGDTAIQVATKIRAATYAGWTAGGTAGTDTVTFTSLTSGVKTDAAYSAGTTGATGTMTTTTQGTADQISTVSSVSGLVVNIADNAARTISAGTILHDDTAQIQAAITAITSAGGGIVFVPTGTYLVNSPIVIYKQTRLLGANKKTTVITKSNSATYTGQCGVAADCVIYMDYAAGESFNFNSTIENIGITANYTTDGIFLGNTSQFVAKNLNIQTCYRGVNSVVCWMSSFENIRIGSSDSFAFRFPSGAHTTLTFKNCYVEACGSGWYLFGVNGFTMDSCAADYTNTGSQPGNPYGTAARGNYAAQGYIFYISSSQGTINGFRAENCTASFVYQETSKILFNGGSVYNIQNYYDTVSPITSFVGVRGSLAQTLEFHGFKFDTVGNQTSSGNLKTGFYVETPSVQKIIVDYIPVLSGYGAIYDFTKDAIYSTGQRSVVVDDKFRYNYGVTELPFILYNAAAFTDSSLSYVVDSTTQARSILISGAGSNAVAGNTINHHWEFLLPTTNLVNRTVRLKLKGTYSTGGYGNPTIKLVTSATKNGAQTTIVTLTLTGGVFDYDAYVVLPATLLTLLYVDFMIIYMSSTITLTDFKFDII